MLHAKMSKAKMFNSDPYSKTKEEFRVEEEYSYFLTTD